MVGDSLTCFWGRSNAGIGPPWTPSRGRSRVWNSEGWWNPTQSGEQITRWEVRTDNWQLTRDNLILTQSFMFLQTGTEHTDWTVVNYLPALLPQLTKTTTTTPLLLVVVGEVTSQSSVVWCRQGPELVPTTMQWEFHHHCKFLARWNW